ncbi:hypothetical protein EDD22DRAFT_951725 [Suillus occidentalis]|nr:hypothetical protein EDD22DRAFT_951725 [Suillus occidentalis]
MAVEDDLESSLSSTLIRWWGVEEAAKSNWLVARTDFPQDIFVNCKQLDILVLELAQFFSASEILEEVGPVRTAAQQKIIDVTKSLLLESPAYQKEMGMRVLHSHKAIIDIYNKHLGSSNWPDNDAAVWQKTHPLEKPSGQSFIHQVSMPLTGHDARTGHRSHYLARSYVACIRLTAYDTVITSRPVLNKMEIAISAPQPREQSWNGSRAIVSQTLKFNRLQAQHHYKLSFLFRPRFHIGHSTVMGFLSLSKKLPTIEDANSRIWAMPVRFSADDEDWLIYRKLAFALELIESVLTNYYELFRKATHGAFDVAVTPSLSTHSEISLRQTRLFVDAQMHTRFNVLGWPANLLFTHLPLLTSPHSHRTTPQLSTLTIMRSMVENGWPALLAAVSFITSQPRARMSSSGEWGWRLDQILQVSGHTFVVGISVGQFHQHAIASRDAPSKVTAFGSLKLVCDSVSVLSPRKTM